MTARSGDDALGLAAGSIPNGDTLRFLHCQMKASLWIENQ